MSILNNSSEDRVQTRADYSTEIFDYTVLDREGDKVGTVNNLWPASDGSGLAFVGVKTGWLFGKDHVVPADGIQVDHERQQIQLPLSKETIKAAPDFEVTDEILQDNSTRIREYYGYRPEYALNDESIDDSGTETSHTTEVRAAETVRPELTSQQATVGREGTTGREGAEIPIREEKVIVGKREVESGGVRLRRVVRKETVNVPVELRTEDVVVERVTGSEARNASGNTEIGEDEVYIPITREEPVVQKTTEVTGAVRARKTAEQSTERVSETVRKEDVEVERNVDPTIERTPGKKGL